MRKEINFYTRIQVDVKDASYHLCIIVYNSGIRLINRIFCTAERAPQQCCQQDNGYIFTDLYIHSARDPHDQLEIPVLKQGG